ncbi:class I SAM-dependent methyltransferase [Aurantimonas sp. HBX-1]|uniref:class I SAM-dependent methyltransferase n=1 Tax=Aurantimonas sp. HBX-1 TaxID=2906072 RepID=UPI001F3B6E0C|nr:class I SAM-dependent methyltransferase [Aurantimonas sp. HBX-1]UIJ71063.1 class I SAM-dependent methyltransferase [Aurantimonas sp. HBX-1]
MSVDEIGSKSKWPKVFPPLTPEQRVISDDFMKYWHDVLPDKYGIVDEFNHNYVVKNAPVNFKRTLEIGAGSGEHMNYEKLDPEQTKNYVAVDIRQNMVAELRKKFPDIQSVVGDCQQHMGFPDNHFDRVLAIHVLEHLPNLPEAVKEMYRLCDKDIGTLSIVIPCEGSWAYSLARRISAQRIFEKRYHQSYRWFIEREHINLPDEILSELSKYFTMESSTYFPIPVNLKFCNLCIGATLRPKKSLAA